MMTEAEKACDWEYPPFRPLLYLSRLTTGFYLNFSFSELGWVKSDVIYISTNLARIRILWGQSEAVAMGLYDQQVLPRFYSASATIPGRPCWR
jgi:hypothetical protein